MNILKERTIVVMNCGTAEITINGKTETATTHQSLIPPHKQKKISRKDFLGDKLTFYSLSEAEWKVVKFSEITEVKMLSHCLQKWEAVIFKR